MRAAWLPLLALLACGAPASVTYEGTGTVIDLDPAARQVRIEHDEIPGFMPQMTMSFDVAEAALLDGVAPGARVRFTLLRSATRLWITDLEVTAEAGSGGAVGASGRGYSAAAAELDVAPPFELTDQDGNLLALSDLSGRAVLLDFVFTRCPGPCPILTAAHAELQQSLPPELRLRTHLVSITLDPEYDTPERLREYARSRGADLDGWSFLSGDPAEVDAVARAYYVGSIRRDDEIDHTIASFLIDPEGRIARRYLGLEHPPEKLRADLEALLP